MSHTDPEYWVTEGADREFHLQVSGYQNLPGGGMAGSCDVQISVASRDQELSDSGAHSAWGTTYTLTTAALPGAGGLYFSPILSFGTSTPAAFDGDALEISYFNSKASGLYAPPIHPSCASCTIEAASAPEPTKLTWAPAGTVSVQPLDLDLFMSELETWGTDTNGDFFDDQFAPCTRDVQFSSVPGAASEATVTGSGGANPWTEPFSVSVATVSAVDTELETPADFLDFGDGGPVAASVLHPTTGNTQCSMSTVVGMCNPVVVFEPFAPGQNAILEVGGAPHAVHLATVTNNSPVECELSVSTEESLSGTGRGGLGTGTGTGSPVVDVTGLPTGTVVLAPGEVATYPVALSMSTTADARRFPTLELAVSGDADADSTSASPPVPLCPVPTGEATARLGRGPASIYLAGAPYDPDEEYSETLDIFSGTLLPSSANFSGRLVQERTGVPGSNSCSVSAPVKGLQVAPDFETSGLHVVIGDTNGDCAWPDANLPPGCSVEDDTSSDWYFDAVGFRSETIYRSRVLQTGTFQNTTFPAAPNPCGGTLQQEMLIDCPDEPHHYATNDIEVYVWRHGGGRGGTAHLEIKRLTRPVTHSPQPRTWDVDNDLAPVVSHFPNNVDCAPLNGFMSPFNTEECDGFDSDCDGYIDNSEIDVDGDGYKACGFGSPGDACRYGLCGDCDDQRPTINPGQPEVPGNGIDEDCDNTTGP